MYMYIHVPHRVLRTTYKSEAENAMPLNNKESNTGNFICAYKDMYIHIYIYMYI
jgi:hypothetical protein